MTAHTIVRTTPAEQSPATIAAASLARFVVLRLEAQKLMEEAAKLPGLPAHYAAQARAAQFLCGIRLHRVIGQADGADALAFRDDLEAIAKRGVDPLIESIGGVMGSEFHNVEERLFKDVLWGAIDGYASHACESAGERAFNDRAEARHDARQPGTRIAREA